MRGERRDVEESSDKEDEQLAHHQACNGDDDGETGCNETAEDDDEDDDRHEDADRLAGLPFTARRSENLPRRPDHEGRRAARLDEGDEFVGLLGAGDRARLALEVDDGVGDLAVLADRRRRLHRRRVGVEEVIELLLDVGRRAFGIGDVGGAVGEGVVHFLLEVLRRARREGDRDRFLLGAVGSVGLVVGRGDALHAFDGRHLGEERIDFGLHRLVVDRAAGGRPDDVGRIRVGVLGRDIDEEALRQGRLGVGQREGVVKRALEGRREESDGDKGDHPHEDRHERPADRPRRHAPHSDLLVSGPLPEPAVTVPPRARLHACSR